VVALKKLAPGHCGLITAIQAGGRDTAGPPYHAFPCARGGWGYAMHCIACMTAVLMNSLPLMFVSLLFFSNLLFSLACSRIERPRFLVFQATQFPFGFGKVQESESWTLQVTIAISHTALSLAFLVLVTMAVFSSRNLEIWLP